MIISTFNRGRLLIRNFERLRELTKPKKIIVVDDGGTDTKTQQVCIEFSDLNVEYIYTYNPEKSLCSHARNIGVKHVETEWFINCEPELIYVTDIIAQMCNIYNNIEESKNSVISAGAIYFQNEGDPVDISYLNNLEILDNYTPPSHWQKATGWVAPFTALWKKEWIEEIGGWDEQFPGNWGWEDIDILTRLRICGHGQYIDQSMKAIHQFHGLGGDQELKNEKHFRAKSFCHGDETKTEDLVANKNIEWGQIKGR